MHPVSVPGPESVRTDLRLRVTEDGAVGDGAEHRGASGVCRARGWGGWELKPVVRAQSYADDALP